MTRPDPTAAPAFADLPPRRESRTSFAVELATVTPILGGSYRTRALDDVDVIRAPTIRGHLRFWWRALYAHEHPTSRELYEAEARLWGGPGGPGNAPARRSPVEIAVLVTARGADVDHNIHPQHTAGAYALFPARGAQGAPAAKRRNGVRFQLKISAPPADIDAVRHAVRAWILFGGYGGRTRRGLGSLTVTADDVSWLPRERGQLRSELTRLFGRDVLARRVDARQVPLLGGATLFTIGNQGDSQSNWLYALNSLRNFRQMAAPDLQADDDRPVGAASPWARRHGRGADPNRPSISNWPEADKVRMQAGRHLGDGPYSHPSRHNDAAAWPRAGFGLPIIGQFQRGRRGGGGYHEPPDFSLTWACSNEDGEYDVRDRLASALIVKPLAVTGGRSLALALWLHRAWPDGKVVLELEGDPVPGSAAGFDTLVAPGDVALFAPLVGKASLRAAFFDWLAGDPGVVAVAP